jgi:hypothetical protein
MKTNTESYLAHLKYYGKLVDEGYLDTKKSANALLGFDEILRYFIYQENPKISEIEFEIPIKIQKGSWLAIIPDSVQDWILTALGSGATAYAIAAAKKMAENDFKEVGLKNIFKAAIKSIITVIRISIHLGTSAKKTLDNVKFRNNNEEIGITNGEGEILWVEKKYVDLYSKCPDKLFSKVTQIIEPERTMEISLVQEPDQFTQVDSKTKHIFYKTPNENDDFIFPDLKDGSYVELDGYVTRGNQNTNSIGFLYKDHILTCSPIDGSITRYKQKLFTHCLMKGYVDRKDKDGYLIEKKPRIIFLDLIIIDDKSIPELNFQEPDN